MSVNRDALYDYVTEHYDIERVPVSRQNADAVVDSAMEKVFEYLQQRGLLTE